MLETAPVHVVDVGPFRLRRPNTLNRPTQHCRPATPDLVAQLSRPASYLSSVGGAPVKKFVSAACRVQKLGVL